MTAFPSAISSSHASPLLGFGGTPGIAARGGGAGAAGGASWEALAKRLGSQKGPRTQGDGKDAATNKPMGPDFRGTDSGMTASVPGLRGKGLSALDIKPGDKITPQQARKAAEEFVSLSLVQPVLAQLRKTNHAFGVFAPGEHEKQFGPLMDAEIALRVTKAQNFPLVDAVARNLLEFSQRREAAVAPVKADSKPEMKATS